MPKSRRVGTIVYNTLPIMKRTQFLALVILLIAANAIAYFSSCRQDESTTITPKPTGDMPAVDRACTDDDWCSYVIEATANCTVILCGDLLVSTGACTFGCGTNSADVSISVPLTANTPYTFCVRKVGSVCVQNPSTALQAINVSVEVAGANTIPVTIGIGQFECFSSDLDCSVTNNFCL